MYLLHIDIFDYICVSKHKAMDKPIDYDKKIAEKKGDVIFWKKRYAKNPNAYHKVQVLNAEQRLKDWEWRKEHNQ
jgi:hypothetical protein